MVHKLPRKTQSTNLRDGFLHFYRSRQRLNEERAQLRLRRYKENPTLQEPWFPVFIEVTHQIYLVLVLFLAEVMPVTEVSLRVLKFLL